MTTGRHTIPAPSKTNRWWCLCSFASSSITVASHKRTYIVYLTRGPEGGLPGLAISSALQSGTWFPLSFASATLSLLFMLLPPGFRKKSAAAPGTMVHSRQGEGRS